MPGIIVNTFLPVGRIINLQDGIIPERKGLGNIFDRWPDLRIWPKGPQTTLEADGARVVVPFKCLWERHYLLCAELLGYPYFDGVGFKRHIPESWRNWEWTLSLNQGTVPTPSMYCTKILSVNGVGGNISSGFAGQNKALLGGDYYPDPQYEFAEVNALFETLMYDVKVLADITETSDKPKERQRYVIKIEESGGRFLTHDWGQWVLKNGTVIQEANTKQVNYWESFNTITYTWLDVLERAFNFGSAKLKQGKSNLTIFDGYQPQTLMLQKVDRKPKMTQLGIRTYEVTFQFLEVPTGVNKSRPPGPTTSPAYWDVVRKGTETNATPEVPFPPVEMRDLFLP